MHYIVITYTFILLSTVNCDTQSNRRAEAIALATEVFDQLKNLFDKCLLTPMPNLRFIEDNLSGYINEFSRTTVGLSPRFTSNRKFFMNMISHPKFKNLLATDLAAIQKSMVEKMKFCDESALDVEVLKQLYDREVDQTKL